MPLPPRPGGAVFIGRRALAETVDGNRQHELLGGGEFHIALRAQFDPVASLLGLGDFLFAGFAAPHGGRTLEIGGAFLGGDIGVMQDRHRNHAVAVFERDATHANRRAALEHAHIFHGKADALAAGGGEQHVIFFGADLHVDDTIALVELHGDDAGRANVREVGKLVPPHRAARRREHHVERFPGGLVLGQSA